MVSHSWFDPSIDVCIIANSICLALREPSVGAACRYSADPAWHDALLTLDAVFTSIFAAELALKLVALGVVAHPGSYFRDPWNWIDAFVVVVAVLGLFPTLCSYLAGLSALRAVRLLRTMRKLRHVSGGSFVTIVSAFIGATPKLVHVAVLLLFTFLCFGILGNQLFMGALRQRCHIYLGEALGMVLIDADTPCGDGGINQCGGWRAAGHGEIFNATWRPQFTYAQGECSSVSTEAHGYGDVFCCAPRLAPLNSSAYYNADLPALPRTTNPDFGFTSFDTVPEAWLVVYRAITIEDWAVVMQMLRNAYQPAYGVSFMLLLVLIPGWLAANLALAVMFEHVHVYDMRLFRRRQREGDGADHTTTPAVTAAAVASPSAAASAAAGAEVGVRAAPAAMGRAASGRMVRMAAALDDDNGAPMAAAASKLASAAVVDEGVDGAAATTPPSVTALCERVASARWFNYTMTAIIMANTVTQCMTHSEMTLRQCQALDVASFVFTVLFVLEMAVKLVGLGVRGYLSDRVNVFDGVIVVINVVEVVVSSAHTGSPWAVSECATGLNFSVFRALRLVRLLYMIPSRSLHELIEILMGTLTKTVALSLIVLLFLFVGTLVGMSYFGGRLERCQPCTPLPRPLDLPITHGTIGAALTEFTSAATGATYSAPALGVGIEPSGAVGGQAASLCACHPELRVCLAPSATDVAPLPFLNAGLPTSAEGAAAGCFARTPYAHFDTFGASLLTTFQIFTGEEWAYPMFLSMRNVHPSTALFFTIALVLGRYVLLNMYTAAILSALVVRSKQLKKEAADEAVAMRPEGLAAAGSILHHAFGLSVAGGAKVKSLARQGTAHVASALLHKRESGKLPTALSGVSSCALVSPARPNGRSAASLTMGGDAAAAHGQSPPSTSTGGSTSSRQLTVHTGAIVSAEAAAAGDSTRRHSRRTRRLTASPRDASAQGSGPPMTEHRAALMLQSKYRQHKAWVNVRAIRLVRAEQMRLKQRGANFSDPLGMMREGLTAPCANATRLWQPPKFSSCAGGDVDAGAYLGAFEEEIKVFTTLGRSKLDFEYLPQDHRPQHERECADAEAQLKASQLSLKMYDAVTRRRSAYERPVRGKGLNRLAKTAWPALRRRLRALIDHRVFNAIVMVLIFASTVVLCLDSARLQRDALVVGDPTARAVLAAVEALNLVFAVLFTIEMALKLVALGWRTYFTNGFNLLDFFCVLISWLTLLPGDASTLGALKSLRTLRGLRPLRLIKRVKAMQTVIEALVRALPAIGNVLLMLLIFWLVFAILGVQVFGGGLSSCWLFVPAPLTLGTPMLLPMHALPNRTICTAMAADLELAYTEGVLAPGSLCRWDPRATYSSNETRCRLLWHKETSGFDDIGESLLTLTEVATMQGWSRLLHRTMMAQGHDLAPSEPVQGANAFTAAAYFVVFVLFGGFVLMKLFVGVVIDKFNRLRDERSGMAFMSEAEKEWVETRKLVQATRPLFRGIVPSNGLRRRAYYAVTSRGFELGIMVLIVLNVGFMALDSYAPPEEPPKPWECVKGVIEMFFAVLFWAEACVKLFGLGVRGYFRVGWNCFDFFLCCVQIFDTATASQGQGGCQSGGGGGGGGGGGSGGFNPMLLRVLRMFRIARLLRLVRSAKGLRTLLLTVIRCAPSLGIICSLLALTCVIFATIGMALFGNVIAQPHLGYGGDWPSFDNFPDAMLLMVVMATSEQWPSVMRATMVQPPFCGEAAGTMAASLPPGTSDCGQGVLAVAFFFLYQLIGALLMMNLMVGVVVDVFSSTSIRENMRVSQTHILEFQAAWQKYDPEGTYYISAHYLPFLLRELLAPLGVRESAGSAPHAIAVLRRLEEAWLPIREGKVQFQETLFALARCAAGKRLPECKFVDKLNKHARRVIDLHHMRAAAVEWNAHEYFAAEMIQRTYRGFRAREALQAHRQREIKRERVNQAFHVSSALLTSFIASACHPP